MMLHIHFFDPQTNVFNVGVDCKRLCISFFSLWSGVSGSDRLKQHGVLLCALERRDPGTAVNKHPDPSQGRPALKLATFSDGWFREISSVDCSVGPTLKRGRPQRVLSRVSTAVAVVASGAQFPPSDRVQVLPEARKEVRPYVSLAFPTIMVTYGPAPQSASTYLLYVYSLYVRMCFYLCNACFY